MIKVVEQRLLMVPRELDGSASHQRNRGRGGYFCRWLADFDPFLRPGKDNVRAWQHQARR